MPETHPPRFGAHALRMAYALFSGTGMAWQPLFALFLARSGIGPERTGFLVGLFSAVMVAGQFLWCPVADRLGRRRVLLGASLASTVALLGIWLRLDYWFVFAWVIVYGLVFSPINPLLDSLALDYVERARVVPYSHLRLGASFGTIYAPFLVGGLIHGGDMRLMFVFAAVTTALGGAMVLALRQRDASPSPEAPPLLRGLKDVLQKRGLAPFLGCVALLQVATQSIWIHYSSLLAELGAPSTFIGRALALDGVCELPFLFLAPLFVRRLGLARIFVGSGVLYVLRLYLYAEVRSPMAALAVELLQGGSFALNWMASVEIVNRLVPPTWRATGQGLLSIAYYGVGAFLGSVWSGYLLGYGGMSFMFRCNAVLALLAIFAGARMLRAYVRIETSDGERDPRPGVQDVIGT